MVKNNKIEEIEMIGGLVCLDFVNSVPNRKETPQPDYILDIQDLVAWGRKAGVISDYSARALNAAAQKQPMDAANFFKMAISFRELLYSIFQHLAEGRKIPEPDIREFNKLKNDFSPAEQLTQTKQGIVETWTFHKEDFRTLLAPILKDSYHFLLTGNIERLKQCPNCGWLFYDTTKNGKRKWCSMKMCGSNIKALAWYNRERKRKRK